MAVETVSILVQDDDVVPAPVDGVTVLVYDSSGAVLITSGVTAGGGLVSFSLPGVADPGTTYQLRFYLVGGSIPSPQNIAVYSPPTGSPTGTNNFVITASLFTLPVATNPRLCRASGFIRGPNGAAREGIDIHWIPTFNPLVVDDEGVLGERVATRTDSSGYLQVDLYRGGMYCATVESMDNVQRDIVVPDRSSVNLNHLLFPIVVSAEFSPAAPFTVATGVELEVSPTIKTSDFRTLGGYAADDVTYSIDDESIATVSLRSDTSKIFIRGMSPGTTTLHVKRSDLSIVYIPDPGINGGDVTITVT